MKAEETDRAWSGESVGGEDVILDVLGGDKEKLRCGAMMALLMPCLFAIPSHKVRHGQTRTVYNGVLRYTGLRLGNCMLWISLVFIDVEGVWCLNGVSHTATR